MNKFYTKLLNLKKVSRMTESGDYLNALNGTKNISADVLKVKSKKYTLFYQQVVRTHNPI